MNRKTIFYFLILMAVVCSGTVEGRQPFHGLIDVSGTTARVSAPNIGTLTNDLRTSALEELVPIYTPTSAVTIGINLRGIPVITAFAANSTVLTVNIPKLGISTSFSGSTRDESVLLLKEYLKSTINGTKRLFRGFAKYSPIDPIAGNPNSLMGLMSQGDYLLGNLSPLSGCDCSWSAQPIRHQFQVGLNVGRGLVSGYETTCVNIPLRYSYSPNRQSAFIIDMPMILNKYDGAWSFSGSFGLAFRFPINYYWSLTPVVRLGSGGSVDLISGANLLSSGFVSNFNYPIWNHVFTVTNAVTYYTSIPLHLGSINYDYHLHNFVFKNGLALTSCEGFDLCNRTINYKFTFIDSDFEGIPLYIEHYDEVGFYLITNYVNPCIAYDSLSVGFSYRFGQKGYRGYNLDLVYQF